MKCSHCTALQHTASHALMTPSPQCHSFQCNCASCKGIPACECTSESFSVCASECHAHKKSLHETATKILCGGKHIPTSSLAPDRHAIFGIRHPFPQPVCAVGTVHVLTVSFTPRSFSLNIVNNQHLHHLHLSCLSLSL